MKKLSLLLVLLASLAYADWNPGGGGGGGAGSVTGGTCATAGSQAVTAIASTTAAPTCSSIDQQSVSGLPDSLSSLSAQIGAVGSQPGSQSAVVSGSCGVAWSGTGLVYNVAACTVWIQGVQYTASATNVTLTAANGSNPRIDAIVMQAGTAPAGTITKVDGTAAASPSTPAVDTTTQLVLAYIQVDTGVTTPTGATNEVVHDGTDTSAWTGTAGTGWTLNDTGNPHSGTKDVKATAVASNAFTKFIRSSTLTLNTYQQLNLWVAPGSGTWGSNRQLQVTIRNASGQQVGNQVVIQNNSFGFSRTSTAYQLIAIPLGAFAVPAGTPVQEVRLNPAGSGGTFTFYVDDIAFQTNTNTLLPAGASYATLYKDANGVSTGTGPGTSGYVLTSTGAAGPPTYQAKLPAVWDMPMASCQNTTAAILWDAFTSNTATAACITGSNNTYGVADFDASTDESLEITATLPADFDSTGTISAAIMWQAAATSGAAGLCVQIACVATGEANDVAYPAQSSSNCVSSTAQGTANRRNVGTISSVPFSTGTCTAGEDMHIKFSRDANGGAVTDDMTGDARVRSLRLTIPRN